MTDEKNMAPLVSMQQELYVIKLVENDKVVEKVVVLKG